MEQRLTIVTLGVKSVLASTSFYIEKFGWQKTAQSNDDISFFKVNGILFALYPLDKLEEDAGVRVLHSDGYKSITVAYNARSMEEVDQLIESLEVKGVSVVKRPQKVFWGGYSSYVSDPDGYLWEIAYNPYLSLDKEGNVSAH